MENGNGRILVLWKTRIGEFFFFFFFIREFSFCGKREPENSRFVKNQNWRIFYFFFVSENSPIVENQNRRIFFIFFFIREFSFCGKPELEIFFFFFNPRILVLSKTGTGEFSFCEKPELENFFFFFLSENSPIVENQNPRIFFFFI